MKPEKVRLAMFVAVLGGCYLALPMTAKQSSATEGLAGANAPAMPFVPDLEKAVIESPVKAVVHRSTPAAKSESSAVNPKVQPGLVRWHADLPAACRASKQSTVRGYRPVLLFQMMGKLHDQFC